MPHISKTERQEIYLLLKKKYSIRDIAKMLGRDPSTISREIKRNLVCNEYNPKKAQHKSYVRKKYCKTTFKKICENKKLEDYIIHKIKNEKWSPEQVAGRWNEENENTKISHITIYRYIYSCYGCDLSIYLYSKRDRQKKRKYKVGKKEIIKNRIWIDDRPKEINERVNIGDFEGDTIYSKKEDKTSILTLVDRKSRFLVARKIKNRKPKRITRKIKEISKKIKFNSITFDNGIEFKEHEKLPFDTYFCHPYSSWEKGQIEYANRLIRRFIPKKSLLKNYSAKFILNIVEMINNTPRKCLNFKTPKEVFFGQNLSLNPQQSVAIDLLM